MPNPLWPTRPIGKVSATANPSSDRRHRRHRLRPRRGGGCGTLAMGMTTPGSTTSRPSCQIQSGTASGSTTTRDPFPLISSPLRNPGEVKQPGARPAPARSTGGRSAGGRVALPDGSPLRAILSLLGCRFDEPGARQLCGTARRISRINGFADR